MLGLTRIKQQIKKERRLYYGNNDNYRCGACSSCSNRSQHFNFEIKASKPFRAKEKGFS